MSTRRGTGPTRGGDGSQGARGVPGLGHRSHGLEDREPQVRGLDAERENEVPGGVVVDADRVGRQLVDDLGSGVVTASAEQVQADLHDEAAVAGSAA